MSFEGFGPTTTFLKDLGRNNSKEWFHDHYDDYQEHLLEPAMAFVEAIGPLLRRFAPDTQAVPKIGASVMRINRDIRFAKDKRPYKDHLDLWFWRGGEKKGPNGYWFRLTPKTLILGGGMHMLDKHDLQRYREAVDDGGSGTDLARVVTKLERAGYDVGGERYKRVPSGYPPDHPRAALLRRDGVYAGLEMALPAEAATAKFPSFCAGHFKKVTPLVDWLADAVG
ncbi:MAG: DUF2461 domain-containing protein [Actinobacteria bacterium]|nr:MAG: DUF2461 domain-containing protein [Actinomycetota bacterium]